MFSQFIHWLPKSGKVALIVNQAESHDEKMHQ
jgi:hypothetical protein